MNIVESSYQFFHKNNHFFRPPLPSGSGCVVTRQMVASLSTRAAKGCSVAPLQRLKTAAEVEAQTMTRLIE